MPQIYDNRGGEGIQAKWKSSYNTYELCDSRENKGEFLRAHSPSQNAEKTPTCAAPWSNEKF